MENENKILPYDQFIIDVVSIEYIELAEKIHKHNTFKTVNQIAYGLYCAKFENINT